MEILLLGGTAFLGREIALAGVRRGHHVTCLARGTSSAPDGVTFLAGDRDDDTGLAPVADARWDCVVDVSRQPGQVRRAVRDLVTPHWVFVSTASVYADASEPGQDEDAPVREPLDGDVMHDASVYGEAKVACEDGVRAATGTGTIVRAGLIGGPGDWSGRSGYWPWRFAHPTGEDVLVPDDPDLPCALIDVRDLADWIVTAAEQRLDGTFNATGPSMPLSEVLATAARVGGSGARPRAVPVTRLHELGIGSWMGPASMPIWIDDPDARGLSTVSCRASPRATACAAARWRRRCATRWTTRSAVPRRGRRAHR